MSLNNLIIDRTISLPYPFGMNMALPIDSRSFFTDYEKALEAVRYAVELNTDENGNFVIPDVENGGSDSEYYYGETLVVVSEGGKVATLYTVVKQTDINGEEYGGLEPVNSDLLSNYVTEENVTRISAAMIDEYVKTKLNVDCLNDYLFTNGTDNCGNEIPSNGLYAYGIKEVDGKIELCDYAKKALSFDPSTPYDKDVNPLATLDTVKGRLRTAVLEIERRFDLMQNEINNKVDKEPGYGLSQNNFTNAHETKLEGLPYIRIEGDKLIINGRAFRLTEWYEIFDYYVGWIKIRNKHVFETLTKDELLDATRDCGFVPSNGKLYGPDASFGDNTFFVMFRKNIGIDDEYLGNSSELHSNGISSPIRTYIESILTHDDVLINNIPYTVVGLFTYRTNSSDTIQIAFNKEQE